MTCIIVRQGAFQDYERLHTAFGHRARPSTEAGLGCCKFRLAWINLVSKPEHNGLRENPRLIPGGRPEGSDTRSHRRRVRTVCAEIRLNNKSVFQVAPDIHLKRSFIAFAATADHRGVGA